MNQTLADAARTIGMNTGLTRRYVDGWTDDQWLRSLDGPTSNAAWIVAHLALTRAAYLSKVGGRFDLPDWAEPFGRGSTSPEAMPAPTEELLDVLDRAGQALAERLPQLTDDELAADCGRDLPSGGRTIGKYVHFMLWHESYHVGQLAVLNRVQGGPGIGR